MSSFRLWHFAYGRWCNHLAAGHRIRSAFWGRIANGVVFLATFHS